MEIEKDLIEATIRDLQQALDELLQRRKSLDLEISERRERLSAWKARLGDLSSDSTPTSRRRVHRRKGENLRLIKRLLEEQGNTGVSKTDIAKMAGIGWSSVRTVLDKNPTTFIEKDGVYFLRNGQEKLIDPDQMSIT